MKIVDLPLAPTALIELKVSHGVLPEACCDGAEVVMKASQNSEARLFFPQAKSPSVTVLAVTASAARTLRQALTSPWPKLCAVGKCLDGERLALKIFEFTQRQLWPAGEMLSVGFDWNRLDGPSRQQLSDCTQEGLGTWLHDAFTVPAAASSGSARLLATVTESTAASGEEITLYGATPNTRMVTASLFRDDQHRVVLRKLAATDEISERVTLLEIPEITFVAANDAAALSPLARAMLNRLSSGTGHYLKLWARYRELDQQCLDREAHAIGYFSYSSVVLDRPGRLRFMLDRSDDPDSSADDDRIDNLRDAVAEEMLELEAASELPDSLLESGEDGEQSSPRRRRARGNRRPTKAIGFCGQDEVDRDGNWIELLEPKDREMGVPPDRGYLFKSQGGRLAAIKRQRRAQDGIGSGLNPMPQLRLLLENQQLPFQPEASTDDNLSALVRDQFSAEPAINQQRAINIAVNTPDIALIQGPPGTGKTQVITAIMKRLEEINDPAGDPAGLFLVTSHQHVAVENVMGKILPFGLPALKIGRSKGTRTDAGFKSTTDWVDEVVAHVGTQMEPGGDDIAALRTLHQLAQAYLNGQHWPEDSALALERAAALATGLATETSCAKLRDRAAQLRSGAVNGAGLWREDERAERAHRAVYALRHTPEAFADDGRLSAARAIEAIEAAGKELSAAETDFLSQLIVDPKAPDAKKFAEIAELRERLLLQLTPDLRPPPVRSAPLDDVGALLTGLVGEVRAQLAGSRRGIDLVLDDFVTDLSLDTVRVERALKKYTATRAETCQGSWGTLDAALRRDFPVRGFETVIVDEAARANPLDLLIPLAQARRRIILVGDHRQLPHTLEPTLEEDVDTTFEKEEIRALKESLFQRLFQDFQRREKDGEPPRTVTLDTQYRMHRTLGDFVSEQFYNNEVQSVLADEKFAHHLTRYRRGDGAESVAAWIDVPAREREPNDLENRKTSISRPLEVRAIRMIVQEMVKEISDRPQHWNLKEPVIGVISFYSAQVKLLQAQFGSMADLVEVGTADAFQGKEFPIVILSMTRSNLMPAPAQSDDEQDMTIKRDRWLRRRFGFLMLQNRMCVALSRQKRLLIVVGDRSMVVDREAERAIPSLHAFERLCDSKGVRFGYVGGQLRWVDPSPSETVP